MAVTAHFIDDDFEFESVLLECALLEGNHTSIALANALTRVTDEFGLKNKVSLVVSDNAANIKGAVTNVLEWKHLGCFAHTLHLVVQDALQVIQPLLSKVKHIVSHFKRNNIDMQKLLKYQTDSGEPFPKKFKQDVSTRWNSTYYMIERLVTIKSAVRATLGLLDKNVESLSLEEWHICTDLVKVLKPFEDVTRKVSGEKYVSGSQIIFISTGLTEVCKKLITKPFHRTVLLVAENLKKWYGSKVRKCRKEQDSRDLFFLRSQI